MNPEKILSAIASSVNHLENAVEAFERKAETQMITTVWHAASDVEYALFLFSLMHQKKSKRSWRLNPRSKQAEVEPLLVSTRDILETAKEDTKAEKFLEAHKKVWIARGHLLRIHEIFEKKRRSGK